MKIIALRNTMAEGQHLEAGHTYDIADAIAKLLIGMNKAAACSADEAPQKSPRKKQRAEHTE